MPFNDFGTTLSEHHTTLPTLADGDVSALQLDASGRLWSVQQSEYADNATWTTGDFGTEVLAVRNDTLAALTGTNNHYIPFTTDSVGALWTHDRSAKATSTAYTSGDFVPGLVVRKNANAALDPDGDYTVLQVDTNGYLKVNVEAFTGTVSVFESGTVLDKASNEAGDGTVALPKNTETAIVTQAVANTEVAYIVGLHVSSDVGCSWRLVSDDGTTVITLRAGTVSPGTSYNQVMERARPVTGSATMNLKLYMTATSKAGNGSGSINAYERP